MQIDSDRSFHGKKFTSATRVYVLHSVPFFSEQMIVQKNIVGQPLTDNLILYWKLGAFIFHKKARKTWIAKTKNQTASRIRKMWIIHFWLEAIISGIQTRPRGFVDSKVAEKCPLWCSLQYRFALLSEFQVPTSGLNSVYHAWQSLKRLKFHECKRTHAIATFYKSYEFILLQLANI